MLGTTKRNVAREVVGGNDVDGNARIRAEDREIRSYVSRFNTVSYCSGDMQY
jgi:hypothetical protein